MNAEYGSELVQTIRAVDVVCAHSASPDSQRQHHDQSRSYLAASSASVADSMTSSKQRKCLLTTALAEAQTDAQYESQLSHVEHCSMCATVF